MTARDVLGQLGRGGAEFGGDFLEPRALALAPRQVPAPGQSGGSLSCTQRDIHAAAPAAPCSFQASNARVTSHASGSSAASCGSSCASCHSLFSSPRCGSRSRSASSIWLPAWTAARTSSRTARAAASSSPAPPQRLVSTGWPNQKYRRSGRGSSVNPSRAGSGALAGLLAGVSARKPARRSASRPLDFHRSPEAGAETPALLLSTSISCRRAASRLLRSGKSRRRHLSPLAGSGWFSKRTACLLTWDSGHRANDLAVKVARAFAQEEQQ